MSFTNCWISPHSFVPQPFMFPNLMSCWRRHTIIRIGWGRIRYGVTIPTLPGPCMGNQHSFNLAITTTVTTTPLPTTSHPHHRRRRRHYLGTSFFDWTTWLTFPMAAWCLLVDVVLSTTTRLEYSSSKW
jgi:hypothetical protein